MKWTRVLLSPYTATEDAKIKRLTLNLLQASINSEKEEMIDNGFTVSEAGKPEGRK